MFFMFFIFFYVFLYFFNFVFLLSLKQQESCAIAKMTAQCALYMVP